jgi:hypothetical protein
MKLLHSLQNLHLFVIVTTLVLGSQPKQRGYKVTGQEEAQESKQRGCKGAGQEEARESHHILPGVKKCEGVNHHTPKATPTLGDGVLMDS